MQAKLTVRRGSANRREVTAKLPTTLGPSTHLNLTTDHRTLSRRHCEILEHDGAVFVRDLGSSNGTLMNGEPVSDEIRLEDGSELTIGPLVFGVEFSGAPKADQPTTEMADAAPKTSDQSGVETIVGQTTVTNFEDATVQAPEKAAGDEGEAEPEFELDLAELAAALPSEPPARSSAQEKSTDEAAEAPPATDEVEFALDELGDLDDEAVPETPGDQPSEKQTEAAADVKTADDASEQTAAESAEVDEFALPDLDDEVSAERDAELALDDDLTIKDDLTLEDFDATPPKSAPPETSQAADTAPEIASHDAGEATIAETTTDAEVD